MYLVKHLLRQRASLVIVFTVLLLTIAVPGFRVQSVLADDVVGLFAQRHYMGTDGKATHALAIGDVDSDGDLDVIVGNSYFNNFGLVTSQATNALYLNDGLSNFTDDKRIAIGPSNSPTAALALGDIDRDGDLDLIVGNAVFTTTNSSGQLIELRTEARNTVYLNDGVGNFTESLTFAATDNTQSVVLADLDENGTLDLVVGNKGEENRIYWNNEGTGFTNEAVQLFGSADSATTSIAVGDVDADGLLDLLVGNFNQPNQLYMNQRNHTFTVSTTYAPSAAPTNSVAIGDLDGQPGPELVVGNLYAQSLVYYNDGHGSFLTTGPFGRVDYPTKDVTLADLNGDRRLDIVIGYDLLRGNACPAGFPCVRATTYHLNDGVGRFPTSAEIPFSIATETSIAVADLNNDGLLDVVEGKFGHNVINFNTGLKLFPTQRSFGERTSVMSFLAVGDFDGINGLDIAAVVDGTARLFFNDGNGNFAQTVTIETEGQTVTTIAAGDIDGDYDLDLLMTQRVSINNRTVEQIRIYQNNGSAGFTRLNDVLERHSNNAWMTRLGDLDGDGDLDLVVGGSGPNEIYLNDGAGHYPISNLYDMISGWTMDLALGDIDGDGDLDIAEANQLGAIPSRIYFNDGKANFNEHIDVGEGADDTRDIAFSDVDNDGDLDILKGNEGQPNRIYLNDGKGTFSSVRTYGPGNDVTAKMIAADLDENGFPDIVDAGPASFYLNNDTGEFPARIQLQLGWTSEIIGADMNRDGHLDLVLGEIQNGLFSNIHLHASSPFGVVIDQPGATAAGVGYYSAEILSDPTLAINYTLINQQNTPIRTIRACYSVNGSSKWQVAVPDGKEQPTPDKIVYPTSGCPYVPTWEPSSNGPLTTSPTGANHTFIWDVHESGFFGRSDNVVFRIEALPDLHPMVNQIAGPYQRPLVASSTQPFRLRGTQIRVIDESGNGIPNALVYQRKHDQIGPGTAIGNGETPYRTDNQGYLQGFGDIMLNDQLLALAPQSWQPTGELAWARGLTETLHLYHTNGMPTADGVNAWIGNPPVSTKVEALGTQVLQVSSANPLLLFDLTVSLEWDASTEEDTTYLGQLRTSLQKASEHLYDFTNGQVALGKITVYQNAEEWGYADVVVQAANRLRPYAVQGGIVTTTTVDLDHGDIHYDTGHVRMGATWSRYGEPGEEVGTDWALALAHELSHYFFFLDDTYLGLDEDGLLVPIDTCIGSIMGDMYDPSGENTELLPTSEWLPACAQTLAHITLGRSEWATIAGRYPMLNVPNSYRDNPGPSWMPFALTTIDVRNPTTPTKTLPDPTFYLNYTDGGFSSSNARAFLLRDNQYAFDLGSPLGGQNKVLVRGAQPNDLLCAFDPPRNHSGCTTVSANSERLTLHHNAEWQPDIQVRPITSSTLEVRVSSLITSALPATLQARIFPEFGEASPVITLNAANNYTEQFSFTTADKNGNPIPVPVTLGHIQLWSGDLTTTTQAAMVAFRMGGDVGRWPALRAGGPALRAGGPALRAGGPALRAGGPALRAGGAPIVSPDGQMIFFTDNPESFEQGAIFTVQSTTILPALPADKRLIGLGYNLLASPSTSSALPGSVSFQYLGVDALQQGVTEADEAQMTIYYHPNQGDTPLNGTLWRPLKTIHKTEYNLVSALSQGPGLYALLAGPQTPFIESVSPTWAYNDAPVTITLTGEQLLPPFQVAVQGTNQSSPVLYVATEQSANQVVFTLPAGLDAQAYSITLINGDQSVATALRTFAVLQRQPTVCFYDTLLSGDGQWELTGDWGVVTLPDSGETAITDSPAGNYRSAQHNDSALSTTITSRPFALTACANPVLTFDHAYVIAAGNGQGGTSHADVGVVEIRTVDGGAWQPLVTFQGGGIYGLQSAALGAEWQGIQLQQATAIDLSTYQGTVQLRFRLTVDDNVADRGWVINQIVVQSAGGSFRIPTLPRMTDRLFLPVVMR